jgi:rhodanese-related sulfurtransferase
MACCAIGCGGLWRALVGGCAIAFVGIAAGGIHSWLRPVALRPDLSSTRPTVIPVAPGPTGPKIPTDPKAPVAAPGDTTATGVALGFEITVEQAKVLYDLGVPFVDAREANFFAEGHVERALNITADQVFGDPKNTAELARWRPGPIVVYCSGGDCDASHHVAQRLQDLQFTQIHIMTDGFPGWKNKGYPAVVGEK